MNELFFGHFLLFNLSFAHLKFSLLWQFLVEGGVFGSVLLLFLVEGQARSDIFA